MDDKISLRQAYILLLVLTFSPFIRFIPFFTARTAKQASWISPFIASVVLLAAVFIIHGLYKKHADEEISYMDIIYMVFGKWLGKVIIFFYFIMTTILLCYFTRYYCERLIATAYDSVDIKVFLVTMFVFIAIVMRTKLVILARMSEIIFLFLLLLFITLATLNIPNMDWSRLTPISTSDIFPVLEGGIGVSATYLLYITIFFMSDKFSDRKKIKKYGIELVIFYTIVIPILVITVVGVLNYSTIERSTIPYLASIKQISLFHTIEKIDSLVVGVWILSDFVLLCFLAYVNIHILESVFNFKEGKHLHNIYLVFAALFSLTFAISKFELEDFEKLALIPLNLFFGLGIPALALIVGKIRKKV